MSASCSEIDPGHPLSPRRHRRAAGLALLGAALLWTGGCARPMERPDLNFPAGDQQDIRGRERTDSDVRTIDRTGQPPDGPVTPGGGTFGPRSQLDDGPVDEPAAEAPPPVPLLAAIEQEILDSSSNGTSGTDGWDAEGYRTIGGIVAEVNGRPIYTDEVIAAVRNELRGLAKRVDREQFLYQSRGIIAGEVLRRINDEMHRLAAERNLSSSDRRRALHLATQYRVNRITAAGGSEARARQRALEETGMTLERLVAEQEQTFLVQLFVHAVVVPRAVPSAEEVRSYYLRHRQSFSTEGRGEIDFLLIELTGGNGNLAGTSAGGGGISREQAMIRAEHVRTLAAGGADFEELAREYNDNAAYKASGGRIPVAPLGRGEFRWRAVDAAIWQTPEGGITPVISEDNGRRLFVAKVLSKSEPRELSFEDVQRRITDEITNRRRIELVEQYLVDARKYAAVTAPDQIERNLQTAMEVLAQQYDVWRQE